MKLLRFGPAGQERPGLLDDTGRIRDLSALIPDLDGKGCDTFGPIGPWLVTRDEVGDVQNLDMWLDVKGQRKQAGNTRTMVFDCATIVSYLSEFMTLLPGDVITTGTPPGVDLGQKPVPVYLNPGDVVTLGIEKLGTQKQTFVAWKQTE